MHIPSVFISYAWESEDFKLNIQALAARLRCNGINAVIDQWNLHLGDSLPEFMEKSIRDTDFTLVVCSPKYRLKSNSRDGGVGYEGDIITSELFTVRNRRKFIPILMNDNWMNSAPSWILGCNYIDLFSKDSFDTNFKRLVDTIKGTLSGPPPISFDDSKNKTNDIPDPAAALQKVMASTDLDQSSFPVAVDPEKVSHYGYEASSGGGYFYDDVLEYRVWGHPRAGAPEITAGSDYYCAFSTFEAAKDFSQKKGVFEEPLVLVRQIEWIDEPSPGRFIHMKTERITEWKVEWLEGRKRKPWSIEKFIKDHRS